MKYQILFSRKNKKNIISLSSAESGHSMVSVKLQHEKMVIMTYIDSEGSD